MRERNLEKRGEMQEKTRDHEHKTYKNHAQLSCLSNFEISLLQGHTGFTDFILVSNVSEL